MGIASISTATMMLLTGMSGAALAQNFMSQEGPDVWRASKLAGVGIYGPDNRKIGNITDVLLDHGGKATAIIIGVGGFLGIGEKDVAIPYDTVAFTQERISVTAQPMVSSGGLATPNGAAPGLGTPATPNANLAATANSGLGTTDAPGAGARPPSDNPSTAYPDHGVIALTVDQLKSAPSFQFAK